MHPCQNSLVNCWTRPQRNKSPLENQNWILLTSLLKIPNIFGTYEPQAVSYSIRQYHSIREYQAVLHNIIWYQTVSDIIRQYRTVLGSIRQYHTVSYSFRQYQTVSVWYEAVSDSIGVVWQALYCSRLELQFCQLGSVLTTMAAQSLFTLRGTSHACTQNFRTVAPFLLVEK